MDLASRDGAIAAWPAAILLRTLQYDVAVSAIWVEDSVNMVDVDLISAMAAWVVALTASESLSTTQSTIPPIMLYRSAFVCTGSCRYVGEAIFGAR